MPLTSTPATVAIRAARGSDGPALARLAALDSRRPLTGALLVAERDGALAAALSLDTGEHVADPFLPTADLVELLRVRAAALAPAAPRRARRRRLALRSHAA